MISVPVKAASGSTITERNESLLFLTLSCTFEKERHEGDYWRFQFGDSESVGSVVSRWVLSTNINCQNHSDINKYINALLLIHY